MQLVMFPVSFQEVQQTSQTELMSEKEKKNKKKRLKFNFIRCYKLKNEIKLLVLSA